MSFTTTEMHTAKGSGLAFVVYYSSIHIMELAAVPVNFFFAIDFLVIRKIHRGIAVAISLYHNVYHPLITASDG